MKLMSSIKNDFTTTDVNFICAVKECREPKKIAEQLEISPSSINVYVQRIEKKLGKKIFLRKQNPTAIELNEEGLDFYPQCKRASQSFEFLYEKIDSQKDYLQGEIKITGPQTLLEHFIIPYFLDFITKNPRINPSLKQLDDVFYEEQEINEFYFTSEIKDDTETYSYFPYYDFVQQLWVSENYLKKHGEIKTIEDLYRHNLLFQKGFFHNPKVMGMPAEVRSSVAMNEIRTFDLTGTRTVDLLCQAGVGIMNGSEETTKLSKLNVIPILPNLKGESIKMCIKVHTKFLSKKLGRYTLEWIFNCRDLTLNKIGCRAKYQLNPSLILGENVEAETKQENKAPKK